MHLNFVMEHFRNVDNGLLQEGIRHGTRVFLGTPVLATEADGRGSEVLKAAERFQDLTGEQATHITVPRRYACPGPATDNYHEFKSLREFPFPKGQVGLSLVGKPVD